MPTFAIGNPRAYTVAILEQRHRWLVRHWQRVGNKFGASQKDELWKIEYCLNIRTRPATTLKRQPKPTTPK